MQNKVVNEKEAAAYIGMSLSYLQHDRCYGAEKGKMPGPAFVKLGRSVRYLITDLDQWITQHKVNRLATS